MRYLHTIFVVLIFALSIFFSFWVYETFAKTKYVTQIDVDSWPEKIKQVQEVFKWIWLYNWEIDWKFSSIKETIINYQIENQIIPHRNHNEAGYFWAKTIKSLKNNYWKSFEDLQEKFLKIEAPVTNEDTYFIVTAYYSPLPWQKVYSTGSYEAELRLNGWWNTASWKKLSVWTIAAPRNYPFWTKIFLEWFWVWVVEDRWGAIVNSWDRWHRYDRLDVWMWFWDEARKKTKAWWIRTIKWKILDSSSEVQVSFWEETWKAEVYSLWKYKFLTVSPENPNPEKVMDLQELLKKVNLYFWEIDWNYDSVKEILIDFQVENWVISSRDSKVAWYFWKKTYEAFKEKFWEHLEKLTENNLENKEENSILTEEDKQKIKKLRDYFYKISKEKYSWKEFDNYIKNTKKLLENYYKNKTTDEIKIEKIKYFLELL